jgi:hypothetical protein
VDRLALILVALAVMALVTFVAGIALVEDRTPWQTQPLESGAIP